MPDPRLNRYRAAIDVLLRGRNILVDSLTDEILQQGDDLTEGGYLFHEFLELQGSRLHFLSLLVSQLEQSAEAFDERLPAPPLPKKAPVKRRSRAKKIEPQASTKGSGDDH